MLGSKKENFQVKVHWPLRLASFLHRLELIMEHLNRKYNLYSLDLGFKMLICFHCVDLAREA